MQSFASLLPHHNPPPHKNHETQITPHAPTKKGATIAHTHALSTKKNHKKGATIAHTHALSTQKSIERAQLSSIPTPFLPKKP